MVQLSFVFKCTSSCCSCSIRGNLLRYWINMWAAASMSQKWRAKSKVRGKKWSFDIFIKVAKGGWKGWYWNMVMSRQAISAFNIYEKWKKKNWDLFCLIQHSVSAQWHAPPFLKIHFKAHIKIHWRISKSCALSEVDSLLDFVHYSIFKHSDLETHCKSLLVMMHLMVNPDGFRWLLMSTLMVF